jgi:hypothetical protein
LTTALTLLSGLLSTGLLPALLSTLALLVTLSLLPTLARLPADLSLLSLTSLPLSLLAAATLRGQRLYLVAQTFYVIERGSLLALITALSLTGLRCAKALLRLPNLLI